MTKVIEAIYCQIVPFTGEGILIVVCDYRLWQLTCVGETRCRIVYTQALVSDIPLKGLAKRVSMAVSPPRTTTIFAKFFGPLYYISGVIWVSSLVLLTAVSTG